MVDPRKFQAVSEVTGETYQIEFQWLQTAISLRHSDTVDVKFLVNGEGKVVAIPHAALDAVTKHISIPLTDDLCRQIAAEHLKDALETGADAEKEILTLTPARVTELVEKQLAQMARR